MKVIEGKHYVESGPACEYKSRIDPSPECIKGRLVLFYSGAILPRKSEDKGECPKCHGTGLQAVELWPDKVKAKWLRDNAPHPHFKKVYTEALVIREDLLHNGTHYLGWEVLYVNHDGEHGRDEEAEIARRYDFSAALTAAVIAVAKEAE